MPSTWKSLRIQVLLALLLLAIGLAPLPALAAEAATASELTAPARIAGEAATAEPDGNPDAEGAAGDSSSLVCTGCTIWIGGPVCVPPNGTVCYGGTHLKCTCPTPGNCGFMWIGTC